MKYRKGDIVTLINVGVKYGWNKYLKVGKQYKVICTGRCVFGPSVTLKMPAACLHWVVDAGSVCKEGQLLFDFMYDD